MRNSFLIFILAVLFAVPALAQDATAVAVKRDIATTDAGQKCVVQETANIGFNFNSVESDLAQVKAKIDKKIEDVHALAKESGVESLDIQSYNYSVYSNNSSGGCCEGDCSGAGNYQTNGSVSFTIKPVSKASELAVLLSQKGFNVNFNVNAYNQCQ